MLYDSRQNLIDRPSYTIDSAFKATGGFGRFQMLALMALTVIRNSGMYLYYGFGFLTLEQSYLCKDDQGLFTEECSAQVICKSS
jgi:hypothetical protein